MSIKVIGVLGTTNRQGITAQMLENVLEGAKARGCQVETIYLDAYSLKMGDAASNQTLDHLDQLARQADCLVLASPTYWSNISGLMKQFLDCFHSKLVHFNKKGERLPGNYRGKSYILLTSCYTSKLANRFSGVTDQTFITMNGPLQAAGMHRLAEAVCTGTFGLDVLPQKKATLCQKIGQQIPKRIQKGGFTLKRYIQLFFMLAITILIVMGVQKGLEALHIIQLRHFWLNYLSFVILSYIFLSLMLRYFAVLKHRRS